VKTYVLDTSALLIFLQKKTAAKKINELLKEAIHGRTDILMSAVNFGEVYGIVLREYGEERTTTIMDAVQPLPIQLLDATPQRALQAASLKIEYRLYYVDSFAAALAVEYKATLVTSDSDFRKLGHGFPLLWLKV
jgi:predicted nucleic acid-binding protein